MLRILILLVLISAGIPRVEGHSQGTSTINDQCRQDSVSGNCKRSHYNLPELRDLPELEILPVKIKVVPFKKKIRKTKVYYKKNINKKRECMEQLCMEL